jgi:hypothetical protein
MFGEFDELAFQGLCMDFVVVHSLVWCTRLSRAAEMRLKSLAPHVTAYCARAAARQKC